MIKTIEITSAGGTITLDTSLGYSGYLLTTTGAVTLLASVNVVTNPSPITQVKPIPIFYNGDINLSGNTFTIVGSGVNQGLCKKEFKVDLVSDGTTVTSVFDANDIQEPSSVNGTTNYTYATSGTQTYVAGIDNKFIRGTGTVSLAGNLNIVASGGISRDTFLFSGEGGLTVGANTFIVFGQTITAFEAINGNYAVFTWNDNGTWRSNKLIGYTGVALLGNIPAFSAIVNPTASSAAPTTVAAVKVGNVLKRGSGGISFGDLEDDSFAPTMFVPKQARGTISSALILTAHASPVSLSSFLPTPPAGFNIEVLSVTLSKGAGVFTSHTDVQIRQVGSTVAIAELTGFLALGSTKRKMVLTSGQYLANANLELFVPVNNPGGSGSDVTVQILYAVVQF